MGDQNKGNAKLALQRLQFDLHVAAQLLVQRRHRLVQQKQLRFIDDRAGQCDALLLSARHFPDAARSVAGQTHGVQRLVHRLGNCRRHKPRASLAQTIGDVIGHRQVRKQGVMLEHHIDRSAIGRQVIHLLTVQKDRPGCGGLEPGQHPQRRRLAAARRPKEGQELSAPDGQGQVGCRNDRSVMLGRAAKLGDGRRGRLLIIGHPAAHMLDFP